MGYDFVRCGSCSLIRLDPVPDEKALAEVYESSYDGGAYATFGAEYDIRLAHAEARVKIVAPHAPEGPWLDVGCSTGAFLDAVSRRGIDIDGIDVSASAVEVAQKRGFSAFHAAAETFQPERRYSYITGFDVLEHVVDPGAFLDRLHGWLAPGGRIALTVPDIKSVHARVMGRHWYYYCPPLHITYFNRETATKLMENHQFWPIAIANAPKVMTIDYITSQLGYFNPWIHRAVAVATRLVPSSLRQRELPIPTGEILVVASA
jgi:SAM-dependent methyltransferase